MSKTAPEIYGATVAKTKRRLSAKDQEQKAGIERELRRVHECVVSVLRGARQDKDVKQKVLSQDVGLGRDAITNFEAMRVDNIGVARFILLSRRLKEDPVKLLKRILYQLNEKQQP